VWSGSIYFNDGNIVRSEKEDVGDISGEEIFYSLLSWLDGAFTLKYQDISVASNIEKPLNTLIVDAMKWFDEYTQMMSKLPPLDSRLFLDFKIFMENLSKLPDDVGDVVRSIGNEGAKLSEIIDNISENKRKLTEYIKKLIELNILSTEPVPNEYIVPAKPKWFADNVEPDTTEKVEPDIIDEVENEITEISEIEELGDVTLEASAPDFADMTSHHEEDSSEMAAAAPETEVIASAPETDLGALEPEIEDFSHSEEIEDELGSELIDDLDKLDGSKADEDLSQDELSSLTEDEDDEFGKLFEESNQQSRSLMVKVLAGFFIVIFASIAFLVKMYVFDKQDDDGIEDAKAKVPEIVVDKKSETETPDQMVAKASPQDPVDEKKSEEDRYKKMSIDELNLEAGKFASSEKWDAAARIYQMALFKTGDLQGSNNDLIASLWKNLAIAYYNLDNYQKALPSVEKSLLLNRDINSLELKAAILEELQEYDKSIKIYRSMLKIGKVKKNQKRTWKGDIKRLLNLKKKAGKK